MPAAVPFQVGIIEEGQLGEAARGRPSATQLERQRHPSHGRTVARASGPGVGLRRMRGARRVLRPWLDTSGRGSERNFGLLCSREHGTFRPWPWPAAFRKLRATALKGPYFASGNPRAAGGGACGGTGRMTRRMPQHSAASAARSQLLVAYEPEPVRVPDRAKQPSRTRCYS